MCHLNSPDFLSTKSNEVIDALMNIWDRIRLAKSFEMTILDSSTSVLKRIERLDEYRNEADRKYYRVELVAEDQRADFKISQHRMDVHDNDITLIGKITGNDETTTNVTGKLFPSLASTLFVTLIAMVLLSMLLQVYTELEQPTSYLLAFITILMVIFSFFHWLSVFMYRQTFDRFLRDWLARV
jgi:hypothetical protein